MHHARDALRAHPLITVCFDSLQDGDVVLLRYSVTATATAAFVAIERRHLMASPL
jgi:hypothetical protein